MSAWRIELRDCPEGGERYQVLLFPPAGYRVPADLLDITDSGNWNQETGEVLPNGCFHLSSHASATEGVRALREFLPGSVNGYSDACLREPFYEMIAAVRSETACTTAAADMKGEVLAEVEFPVRVSSDRRPRWVKQFDDM